MRFHNDAPYNSGGDLASLEQATNFLDAMDSVAGQVVSTIGSSKLNEFRVQYAHRHQGSVANSDSGTGPAVSITGIASFGGPLSGTGQGNAGFDFKQNITQVIDNFTYIRAAHSYKFGIDMQRIHDERIAAPQFLYTFPSIATYLAAKTGTNRLGYSSMTQITGDLNFAMDTSIYSPFVQDDWQIAPTVKVLYGVRYDLYQYPTGLPTAPLTSTQNFNIDKNNFGPRVGVAWSIDDKTVLRASTGLMYDQPILGGYEQALQLSGSPKAPAYTFTPACGRRAAFPSPVSAAGTLAVQSPWAVDPNFVVARTFQTNIQVERSLGRDYTASVGFIYANGDNLPVVTDVNLIGTGGTLADGRPIYSGTVSAATRVDPRFNHINEVQSIGDSTFKGLTLQMSKRLSKGLTYNIQYVAGKGHRQHTAADAADGAGRTGPFGSEQPRSRSGSEPARHPPEPLRQRRLHDQQLVVERRRARAARRQPDRHPAAVQQRPAAEHPLEPGPQRRRRDERSSAQHHAQLALPAGPPERGPALHAQHSDRWHGPRRDHRGAQERLQHRSRWPASTRSSRRTRPAIRLTPIPTDPYGFSGASGYEQRKFQLGFKVRF